MKDIQIYARRINLVEPNGIDSVNIHLDGVDVSQVVAEFTADEILGSLEMNDIREFVNDNMGDE